MSARNLRASVAIAVAFGLFIFACANSDSSVSLGSGVLGEEGGTGSGGFVQPDALAPPPPVLQCPTSECTAQYTTCPDSIFPCDVDLSSDSNHCGSCGTICPQQTSGSSTWTTTCAGGECHLLCTTNFADCNGKVEDGCEIQTLGDPANCGACGNACAAGVSCIGGKCGCPSGQVDCDGTCTDIMDDAANCGACDHICIPPDGGVPPPHMVFGCSGGVCGKLKCIQDSTSTPEILWTDCNGNQADGCEVNLADDNANCVTCGVACEVGQKCSTILQHYPPYVACACPGGQVICPGQIEGAANCVNIDSDQQNCGTCGVACGSTEACIDGECVISCPTGTADCNGDHSDGPNLDGCETNTATDPSHCGGCTTACDSSLPQPCQAGTCATKDCVAAEAGVTK